MKYIILLIAVLMNVLSVAGNNMPQGVPFITNYSERDFKVSTVNYDIVQDKRGVLYFANEYGILEFDGSNWAIVTAVSNHSNIKSLAITKDNRLYAGAQGDFGYVDYRKDEGLVFYSLLDLVPKEHRDFNDVWEIIIHNKAIYFHTWKAIYKYDGKGIEVIKTGHKIKRLFKVRDQVFMHDHMGLHLQRGKVFERLPGTDKLRAYDIEFILPIGKGNLLVGTHWHGLYRYIDGQLSTFKTFPKVNFNDVGLTVGHIRRNGDLAVGTMKGGVYIFNDKGEVKAQLSKREGLQNNVIRGLYTDHHDNLWVTHKKGIDMIELSTPLYLVKPDLEEPTSVYASLQVEKNMYFATHNGLLKQAWQSGSAKGSFERVPHSNAINWNLMGLDDLIVVAHAKGFSQLINDQLQTVYEAEGGWVIKAMPKHPGYFIGGTYSGLILLKEEQGRLNFVSDIEGFGESSRVIEIDDEGEVWVAHGYRGIYRLVLNDAKNNVEQMAFYNYSKGLPSHMFNTVFKVWDELVFGTQVGFYKYDSERDTMVMHPELTELVGYEQGRLLREDNDGNVWFISGNRSGIIKQHADGSQTVVTNPFNKLDEYYIPGFENLYFSENNGVYIGTKDGIIIYNPEDDVYKTTVFKSLIRSVENTAKGYTLYEDDIENLCDTIVGKDLELSYEELKNSSLQFNFSASFYEDIDNVRFKYFLQGYDSDWSEWEDIRYKEYTNLKEGDYLFRLKAINIYGTESDELVYRFSIQPPWYRTMYAYFIYTVMFISIFYLAIRMRERRLKIEKQRYIEKQERIRKIEQAAFQEEKLMNELESKNNELAAMAMQTICKNEKLIDLQDRITTIKGGATKQVEQKLADLLSFIASEIADDNWDDFELRFDLAHNNYIKKLKEEFPILTPHDLKICAYLKMNLSSKEIAQLQNMTVRGVENARYRIRKRLELDSSVHLTDWLMSR